MEGVDLEMDSSPVKGGDLGGLVEVVVSSQVVVGSLSSPTPEVDFGQIFMVRGGVGPVQGVKVGAADGKVISGVFDGSSGGHPVASYGEGLFDVRADEERGDHGRVPKIVKVGLIGVIENTEETFGFPLGGHGEERRSTSQVSVGGDKGDQGFFNSSVVHNIIRFVGANDGGSAVDFSAELKDVKQVLGGGDEGGVVFGFHDTFSRQVVGVHHFQAA